MRQSKFTETQIVSILKEADVGRPVNELWRKYGISSATYSKWKATYGGLDASEVKRLKELEHENRRLKRMDADLSLENAALKDLIEKSSAARGTASGRHPLGDPARPLGSAGLSSGGNRSGHLLSAPRGLGPARCPGDRGPHDARGGQESLGLLEVLRSTPIEWPSVESHAAVAGVRPTPAEPPPSDQEAAPGSVPSATRGDAAAQRGVGCGFYERHAVWRTTIPDSQYSG